jgi:iron complex outermembrane recepter protein
MNVVAVCRIGLVASLGVGAVVPTAAAAELEEITVTAQRREQSLQETSVAVTAVSSDRLQAAQINNIEDLQLIVPSVYFGNDFNMAKLTIRGVGANTSTTGSETGVAMHVDGAVVSRAEAQLTSLFDLERVEVLRGPQGSLYGRNAVGGSINLITAKPTKDFGGYARLSYGDYQYVNFEGALSGPLVGERILGRLAVKDENRDGFGRNPVTGNDIDDLDRRMARGLLQFNITDQVDALLTGEYYKQEDRSRALKYLRDAFPGVVRLTSGGCQPVGSPCTYATNRRDIASEIDPFTDTKTWAVTGTINWHLTDALTLSNITNYRDFKTVIGQDLDLAATANSLATTGFNTTYQRRDVDSEQTSSELQLKFESERVNGVFGLFYLDETQRPVDTVGLNAFFGQAHILPVLANPAIGAFPPISATGLQIDGVNVPATPIDPLFAAQLCNTAEYVNIDPANPPAPKRVCIHSDLGTEAYAAFGQVNLTFGDWILKLGGRYSDEERTASNPSIVLARNGLGPVLLTSAEGTFNKRDFHDFTPEAGLTWRRSKDLMIYYTYSEGFKAGAGENAAPGAATNFVSVIVDPEKIRHHEIGLKSTWLENRLALNVAAYAYDLDGQQINKTLSGGPAGFSTIFQNAAQTSAEGVELEMFASPTDRFRASGGISYLHSRYDDFLTKDPLDPRNVSGGAPAGNPATDFVPPNGVPDVQLAGNPTRNSPDWSGNLHAEYDFPLAAGTLTLMGDVSYKDDVFFTEFARPLEGQDAYTILDLQLRFAAGNGRWTAELWGKNITDEEVVSSTFQLATARVLGATYMPPRTYGITFGYRFAPEK